MLHGLAIVALVLSPALAQEPGDPTDRSARLEALEATLGTAEALELAEALLTEGLPPAEVARVRYARGVTLAMKRRFDEAQGDFEFLLGSLQPGVLHARAAIALGNLHGFAGRYAEAEEAFALALRDATGELRARAQLNLGNVALARGSLVAAAEAYQAASRTDSLELRSIALFNLAYVYDRHGLYSAAWPPCREALAGFDELEAQGAHRSLTIGSPRLQCLALSAVLHAREGSWSGGDRLWAQVDALVGTTGLPTLVQYRSEYLALRGDLEGAAQLSRDALAAAARGEVTLESPAGLRVDLARLELRLDRVEDAEALLAAAAATPEAAQPFLQARLLETQAQLAERKGDQAAARHLRRVRAETLTPWLVSQRSALARTTLPEEDRAAALQGIDALFTGGDGATDRLRLWAAGLLAAVLTLAFFWAWSARRQRRVAAAALEEERRRERKAAAQHLRALAHDINNPLTALSGALDLASRTGATDPLMEAMEVSASRIQAITAEAALRAQLRTYEGVEPDLVDLGRIVRMGLTSWSAVAATKGLRVVVEVETDHHVSIHEAMAIRVVDNLVSNAIKYSAPGGRISLRVREDGEQVCLAVEDEGVGLAPEELQRFFAPDQSLSSLPTGDEVKTGIGMSITREIVERHAGTIRVARGRSGRGLEVCLCLPMAARTNA